MRDYFKPFLLNNLSLGDLSSMGPSSETLGKIKIHVMWALAAGGIGFVAWKVGQWQSAYKMVKRKLDD